MSTRENAVNVTTRRTTFRVSQTMMTIALVWFVAALTLGFSGFL
jgi:hypothetical protein